MCSNGLLAIFLQVIIYTQTASVHAQVQLDEGRNCPLENGEVGICKKLPDCPSRVTEVQAGKRDSASSGRCGFDSFTEIVCCPTDKSSRIRQRPSATACERYKQIIANLPPEKVTIPPTAIFNGLLAFRAEFPYAVALGYENEEKDIDGMPIKYSCGGSLISPQHVLTAAHCVDNLNKKVPVQIWVGHEKLGSSFGQVVKISSIISHPKYRRTLNYHDVAILKLEKELQFTHSIKPICLPTKQLDPSNLEQYPSFVVIGWGSTAFFADGSFWLNRTPGLSIVNRTECAKSYNDSLKLPRGLDENMICAIHTDVSTNSSDACHGDSGGPLIMSTLARETVVGIISFGQTCAGPVPGVYMSVYSYLDWIEDQVWPDLKEPSGSIDNSDLVFHFVSK